jgi:flagellar M-ring protein FliF
MRAIEMVVMGLLGFVVLLFVVRPLVRRIITPDEARPMALPAATIDGSDMAAAEVPSAPPPIAISEVKGEPSQTSKMIDLAQVQGQVHAQSVQKVGEIADKNPRETISIIRQWLHESAAA